jgi:xylose isomerase
MDPVNPNDKVEGRTMAEHLRFSVVYWHTFLGPGSDTFGPGPAIRPWDDGSNSLKNARNRARVAFEFIEKLGLPFYAFDDRDIAPDGKSLKKGDSAPNASGRPELLENLINEFI